MPDVLGAPPSPRTALFWNGTAWQWALVDAAGHLQLDVVTSALPGGAATAANQALILAQLQLIEDMRAALESVGTDRLIVRGEDQLFTFKERIAEYGSYKVHGGGSQNVDFGPVPADEVWIITSILALNSDGACASIRSGIETLTDLVIARRENTVAMNTPVSWSGHIYAEDGDIIRVRFYGTAVNDDLHAWLHGYVMTLET